MFHLVLEKYPIQWHRNPIKHPIVYLEDQLNDQIQNFIFIKDNVKSLFNIREKSIHAVQSCLDETSSQDVVVAIDRFFVIF